MSQWYVLNDFSINSIRAEEAVTFNLRWKVPCVFFYQAVNEAMPESIRELQFKNPITSEVMKLTFMYYVYLVNERVLLKTAKPVLSPLGEKKISLLFDIVGAGEEFWHCGFK